MSKIKRTFSTSGPEVITIVGGCPDGDPYIKITNTSTGTVSYINSKKEIKRLAVNILKLLAYSLIIRKK